MRLRAQPILALLLLALTSQAYADAYWFQIGPARRVGMKVKTSQHTPIHAGCLTDYADREYIDGYVKQDPGTGNPAAPDPNATWNWGYQNASQYDGSTLSFHAPGALNDSSFSGNGFEMVGGIPLFETGTKINPRLLGIDLCVGLQFIGWDNAVVGYDVTDRYNVPGITMPGAGHQGSYDGPFDTPAVLPSPVIPNLPSQRILSPIKLNTDLIELWIGPRFTVDVMDDLSLFAMPKLSINFINAEVSRAAGSFYGDFDSRNSDFKLGAGTVFGAEYALDNLTFTLWGGYEWVDSMDFSIGSGDVELDASGFTFGISIGYTF